MRFSRLSSIYECCSQNSFYYIIRNNLLNDSFLLNETEFKKLIKDIKENKESKDTKKLVKINILVPENYSENKFIEYIKQRYALDKPLLEIIYLTFNTECNLKCKYCYVEGSFDKKFKNQTINKVTFENLLEFLDNLIKEGKKKGVLSKKLSFIFYGSEPLLCPDYVKKSIEKIEEVTKKLNIKKEIQIITNGTLINEDLIKIFKKYHVKLAVSLDGPKITNDSMRIYKNNSGTYNKILLSLKKLKRAGVVFGISCTIGPHNVNNLVENIKLFKRLGAGGVGFNILLHAKNQKVPFVSLNYSNDKLIEASSFANKNKFYEDRIQRKVKSFNKSEIPHFKDCGAVGNQIVFYPNGEIGLCQAYLGCRNYLIGNVVRDKNNPLKILNSENIKKWTKRYPLNMNECIHCPAIGICGGGCVFNAEVSSGSIYSLDKPFCVHTVKILNWLLRKSLEDKLKTKDVFIRDISFMFNRLS